MWAGRSEVKLVSTDLATGCHITRAKKRYVGVKKGAKTGNPDVALHMSSARCWFRTFRWFLDSRR